jgi:hypothetical protein
LESLVGKDVTESRSPIERLWGDRAIVEAFVDRDARSKMATYLLPVLCRALNDESAEVRIQAAFASNAESAIPALREALVHGDDRLRKVVEVAIVLIDSGEPS